MKTTKEFNLNEDIVNLQINLLLDFTQSFAYYRALNQNLSTVQKDKPFWVYTMNTHYFRAITDWCIVFGADSNNAHWKNVSEDDEAKIKLEIRPRILAAANFTCDEWKSYHKQLKDFRDNFAAHRSVNPCCYIAPNLDKAFEIAGAYIEWLRESLNIPNHQLENLEVSSLEFQKEVLDVLSSA